MKMVIFERKTSGNKGKFFILAIKGHNLQVWSKAVIDLLKHRVPQGLYRALSVGLLGFFQNEGYSVVLDTGDFKKVELTKGCKG